MLLAVALVALATLPATAAAVQGPPDDDVDVRTCRMVQGRDTCVELQHRPECPVYLLVLGQFRVCVPPS